MTSPNRALRMDLNDAITNGIEKIHGMRVTVSYEGNGVVFIEMHEAASRHGRECLLLLGNPVVNCSNAVVVPVEMLDQLLLTYAPAHYAPVCGLGE